MANPFPPWLPPLFALCGRVAPARVAELAERLLTEPGGQNEPQDWELEPGTPPARERVTAGGIHLREWGEGSRVVLAQHGWRGRTTQFRRLAEALVPRGFRLVAVEGPGHGRTPGRRATPRILADNLAAVARELGGVEALVGHSLGGAAAGIALADGLPAARAVLIASPTRVSRLVAAFAAEVRLPPRARAALARSLDRHAGRPAAELDLVPLAARLALPVLVVHDRDDDVIPVAEAEELLAAWPGAAALITQGLGHRDVLGAPEVVARTVEFIAAG